MLLNIKIQSEMKSQDYINRRKKLCGQVGQGIILLPGNNLVPMNYPSNTLPFRQDSNFLYFAGIDLPGLVYLLDCEKGIDVLFANEPTTSDTIWTGHQTSMHDLANPFGINTISELANLPRTIASAIENGKKIHYLPPYPADRKIALASLLGKSIEWIEQGASPDLIKAVVSQRLYKSEGEIAEIEEALEITRKFHIESIKMARPGIYEYDVVSQIYSTAKKSNTSFAYPVICTVHGEILHNENHGNQLKEGQLLLIDAGVESKLHYASDITRTFPVGGRFSAKQKEIYEIVLSTQLKIIETCKPGIRFFDLHFEAAKNITEGLIDLGFIKGNLTEAVQAGAHTLFFPHGLGHAMGLDVHDMEDLGENFVGHNSNGGQDRKLGGVAIRFSRALEPGFVMTVEPGIYFIPALIDLWIKEKKCEKFINYAKVEEYTDFGGIRIEDNVLVTQSGCRVLGKPIPKGVNEVEALYSK
jgi:Xaa-Pro aminopeptidase